MEAGLFFFLQDFPFLFSFLFSSDRKPENLFFSLRAKKKKKKKKNFQDKEKSKIFFSKQRICSEMYIYIVYMFVYSLDIGSECICTY